MSERGQYNDLVVRRRTAEGAWLGPDDVFLPGRQVPEGTKEGDVLRVFVYGDAEGRPVATTDTPAGTVGEIVCLQVVDVFEHGAFLDWGLDKELFVPWARQHERLEVGRKVVVALCLDARGRMMGASHLAPFLEEEVAHLEVGQAVHGLVYGQHELGALAVVDGRYGGLIYANQTYRPLRVGDETLAWIRKVRPDGKLDLALQRPGRGGIDDARETVLERLRQSDGFLPLTDKSDPKTIQRELNMSKKAFKRAIGGLYKDRLVELTAEGVRLTR